ncbi:hypothetical protein HPP92_028748 [Vanilla planifolia]|uniref:Uncharacterized protein n=1 Tax=Vanilla planifolia TaxID=51239 RepID=A0A835P525_VANPL|nr:hypothetical protein HPP92_028748 [Vanilla planifolia]KAG0446659.1 hypothetical protein HPP92_028737 [Vanilla planifolia]
MVTATVSYGLGTFMGDGETASALKRNFACDSTLVNFAGVNRLDTCLSVTDEYVGAGGRDQCSAQLGCLRIHSVFW